MPGKLQLLARDLLPPLIARPLARRFRGIRFVGDYESWAAAAREGTGYDAPNILTQVTAAARKVRDGEAAFERDGVVFQEPDYRWPLVACLLREAMKHDGRLRVLDFGGALGSSYFQHRSVLRGVTELHWGVVEQPMFVEAGRREFTSETLSFHATVGEAVNAFQPNVLLFSGVLGWIESPHAILAEAVALRLSAIIVDRTAVTGSERDVIKLQHVPASICRASYPCWFLSQRRFLSHFAEDYPRRTEFPQSDAPVPGASFGGFYFERDDRKTHVQ